MTAFNEFATIRGLPVESNVLEAQRTRELFHNLRPMPEFDLPRYFFGFKKRSTNTSPSGWREVFELERDTATDALTRKTFEQVLQLVDIAEDCGATNLLFGTRSEHRISGFLKVLYLEDIRFHRATMTEDMSNFSHRLLEIGS